MGWRPDDFWKARLPEVIGAIVGDSNKRIEDLKLAWEPARYVAYIMWNVTVDRKYKLKSEQQLRRFSWEKKEITKEDVRKALREAAQVRNIARNKWNLKYKEDVVR